jgi:EmrB/QacA subfamily drug resistance transporter
VTETRPSTSAAPAAITDEEPYPQRWLALGVIAMTILLVILDATIVNIALPAVSADLEISVANQQWIVTAYTLTFGGFLLLGGRIADFWGRKRTYLVGAGGFAIASALGGIAQNEGMLFAARALQGAFGALLAPASLALITVLFTDTKERAKAFAVYGAIAGGGSAIGLLLGGVLTEYLNWRWTMYVNIVFAVAAAIGGAVLLAPHAKGEVRERIDKLGAVLACGSMFAIVYGFAHAATASGAAGWSDPQTLGFLAAGVVLLVAFVITERRVAHPLLPLRILTDRNRAGAYIAMFLASVGMFGVFLFLTYYLEATRGFSPVKTGLAFLPMTVVLMVSAALGNTVLLRRYSPRLLVPLGLLASAAGMLMLTRIDVHSSYAAVILPPLVVMAVGFGLVFAPCFSLGTLGVRPHDAGVASATVNVSTQIGGSIGTALLNTIATSVAAGYVASHAGGTTPVAALAVAAAVHSYVVVFWIGAAIFVAAALIVGPLLRPGVLSVDDNEQMGAVAVHA